MQLQDSSFDWVKRASRLLAAGDAAASERALRDGLAHDPQHLGGWSTLANTLTLRHAYDEALAAADRALAIDARAAAAHVCRARALRGVGRLAEAVAHFRRACGDVAAPQAHHAHALMGLGEALDAAGDYDEAWAAIDRGQAIRRALPGTRRLDATWLPRQIEAYTRWVAQRRGAPPIPWTESAPVPAFLVGVPRSGTTLMEQILVAAGLTSTEERPVLTSALVDVLRRFPGIVYPGGLDTLPAEVVRALRRQFLARAPAGGRVLHKLPLDLLQLGLVERVFPGARVVLAVRDPRDTVASGYFQNLVLNPAMVHWTDLTRLTRATVDLLALGRASTARLDGLAIRVQRYEALTEDPTGEGRALVAHVGAAWTEQVASFHETAKGRAIRTPSTHAVTEPVHRRARARWRRYADPLEPWLPELEQAARLIPGATT